ncbi:lycopene cyclase domain-containing protein [Nocardioides pacificus]
MTEWLYLLAILASTFCMGLVDRRWTLFLFARPGRALIVLGAGLVLFLAWDLVAIALEIYARGESSAMTGIELAPELPLEELFFIVFLCYHTMVVHGLALHVLRRRGARPAPTHRAVA